jgi:UDP-2-acetamido-2-deoxy-ribo-hexuluronate aminotransferase
MSSNWPSLSPRVWRDELSMKIPFIDLKKQYQELQGSIQTRINRVLEHGQYIMGPEVEELEEKLIQFSGADHCITVSSGTDALLISLMSLGVGPGDEVITTPFTFVATVEVIVLLGARPVFVDVESETCNIDVSLIEEKITERTKAIIPVSLYGQPSDMDEINQLAAKYGGIPVIEDAAQSFGATYKNRKSCNLSTIGCTSFFPSKPLGCYGDGGAIFTSNLELAEACRQIRVHGQSKRYVHTRIGIGGRMDTLQCAVVLAKLERFDWEVEQRTIIGEYYNEIMDSADVRRVHQRSDRNSTFAQYTILVDQRDDLQRRLSESGIPTAVHYPVPLNQQRAYRDLCCPDCTPVSNSLADQVMSIPMSADLSKEDQDRVGEALTA